MPEHISGALHCEVRMLTKSALVIIIIIIVIIIIIIIIIMKIIIIIIMKIIIIIITITTIIILVIIIITIIIAVTEKQCYLFESRHQIRYSSYSSQVQFSSVTQLFSECFNLSNAYICYCFNQSLSLSFIIIFCSFQCFLRTDACWGYRRLR